MINISPMRAHALGNVLLRWRFDIHSFIPCMGLPICDDDRRTSISSHGIRGRVEASKTEADTISSHVGCMLADGVLSDLRHVYLPYQKLFRNPVCQRNPPFHACL